MPNRVEKLDVSNRWNSDWNILGFGQNSSRDFWNRKQAGDGKHCHRSDGCGDPCSCRKCTGRASSWSRRPRWGSGLSHTRHKWNSQCTMHHFPCGLPNLAKRARLSSFLPSLDSVNSAKPLTPSPRLMHTGHKNDATISTHKS